MHYKHWPRFSIGLLKLFLTMKRKLFLFFFCTLFITVSTSAQKESSLQLQGTGTFRENLINKPIIDYNLKGTGNKQWKAKELMGKVVIFNFWFTACKPCISEMPHLNGLVKDNEAKEVIFIAPAPENQTQINKFLKKYSFDYNIIPSSLDFINQLKVESFPTHLVIDQSGIIRQVFIGYSDDIREKLQAEIDRLLK